MELSLNNLDEFYPENRDVREGVIVLVDKPLEWTSFDVVKKIRIALQKAYSSKKFKVGHAGTLDPLATGLLLVLMGKATRLQDSYMKESKVYEGEMELGFVTESFDSETEKIFFGDPSAIAVDRIHEATQMFHGAIEQIPPKYSAIKVDGIPLYKYAREGQKVDIKTRMVQINSYEITAIEGNRLRFRVDCGSGTYIRSLVHDYGQELGCGAYLTQLRRVSIGKYNIEDALSVNELISVIDTRYKLT